MASVDISADPALPFEEFPWTPHTALWQPKADATRGGAANDAKDPSAATSAAGAPLGGEILCFIEPKTARWAAEAYGVETDRRPFLLIAAPATVAGMQKGDVVQFGGEPLKVEFAPRVMDFEDGNVHAETMLTGATTGGRGA